MTPKNEDDQVSIVEQLRHIISDGDITPEDAVEKILSPYGTKDTDPLCAYVWPVLLRLSRNIQAKNNNQAVRRNVHRTGPFRNTDEHREANHQLRTTVFRDRDGGSVRWDDVTIDHLDRKIAWIRAHIGTLTDHLHILEHARNLMEEVGATRLGDVRDWPDLLRERAGVDAASIEILA